MHNRIISTFISFSLFDDDDGDAVTIFLRKKNLYLLELSMQILGQNYCWQLKVHITDLFILFVSFKGSQF